VRRRHRGPHRFAQRESKPLNRPDNPKGEIANERLVAETLRLVKLRLAGQAAGHGIDHVLRVLRMAGELHSEVGGDFLVIELAAILHDVGDAKFHDGVERSAEFAREILAGLGASGEVIEQVANIVDNISFRKGVPASELSLEAKVVQDADRLDALGAVGIVRTIEFGAERGQPFYLAKNPSAPQATDVKTGVGHFHEKLLKLPELLNTEPARRIAVRRAEFLKAFLDQFLEEVGETPEGLV